jgi:hypothetical protein
MPLLTNGATPEWIAQEDGKYRSEVKQINALTEAGKVPCSLKNQKRNQSMYSFSDSCEGGD